MDTHQAIGAVHDMYGAITLGSWFDISGPVLCAKKRTTHHNGIVGKVDKGESKDTTTTSFVSFDEETPGGASDIVQVSPNATDICGDIPAKQVFDVQWSGEESQTDQYCRGFDAPFDPSSDRRLTVDQEFDHYRLGKTPDGSYVLQLFDRHGKLKGQLSGGKVKLANTEVLFYIIGGWYGTIITKSKQYNYDSVATFKDLTRDPILKVCEVVKPKLINTTDFMFLQVDR